jgi:protein-L-isoaspartate(D-aspartate) O-methyltransferase
VSRRLSDAIRRLPGQVSGAVALGVVGLVGAVPHGGAALGPGIALGLALLSVACTSEPSGGGEPEVPAMSPIDRSAERHAMVTKQIEARGVRDPLVLAALRVVPRERFVPLEVEPLAYDDGPQPIGHFQTISQPYIVARMTEALGLQPGEKVLEIGTGSGYQAAVLAEITPHVFTIEIVEPLAQWASAALHRAGYDGVACRLGDGYQGWPSEAPFDAIIVTAAPDHVPAALVEQLAPGGRLCLPVGAVNAVQELVLLEKDAAGEVTRRVLDMVRFVPMTGDAQER